MSLDLGITPAPDDRVQRSPVPDGFEPTMFRNILSAIDVLYHQNGSLPTVDEIMGIGYGLDKHTVSKALTTPELKTALALRGIALDPKAGLTDEQLMSITVLSDPTDMRSTSAKMAQVGVSMATYRAWMRNPLYSKIVADQSEHNLGDSVSMALNRLVANAEAGDARSIEKILEITGRWNPQAQEVQNAKQVVLMFMESLQRHVPDKEILQKIMDDVSSKAQILTITNSLKEIRNG